MHNQETWIGKGYAFQGLAGDHELWYSDLPHVPNDRDFHIFSSRHKVDSQKTNG